ncbi:MAG: ribosome-associated translation inhibitor RaiA [Parachlamydiaceae bacterium]|nr:ribosome-associated translation inhibitor RaiA [Parachlamydiaceae bacterium]
MSRKAKALQFADEGYNIQITGRHVQITEAMKAYAIEKASKIERFSDRIIDVNIILDIQKLEHRAEIILKVGHTKIRGQGISDDMYVSIDKAATKIESQLRRYQEKLHNHHTKKQTDVEMNVNLIRRPKEEEEFEFDEAVGIHEIAVQKTVPLKMLTADEALMKMELSGDPFLIYKSEEDQKLKVIYRLKSGDYGLIEPQC